MKKIGNGVIVLLISSMFISLGLINYSMDNPNSFVGHYVLKSAAQSESESSVSNLSKILPNIFIICFIILVVIFLPVVVYGKNYFKFVYLNFAFWNPFLRASKFLRLYSKALFSLGIVESNRANKEELLKKRIYSIRSLMENRGMSEDDAFEYWFINIRKRKIEKCLDKMRQMDNDSPLITEIERGLYKTPKKELPETEISLKVKGWIELNRKINKEAEE